MENPRGDHLKMVFLFHGEGCSREAQIQAKPTALGLRARAESGKLLRRLRRQRSALNRPGPELPHGDDSKKTSHHAPHEPPTELSLLRMLPGDEGGKKQMPPNGQPHVQGLTRVGSAARGEKRGAQRRPGT